MQTYLLKTGILSLFFMIYLHSLSPLKAQPPLPSVDSVDMLIANQTVQIECTEGINDLYNFNFERATNRFSWLERKYPTHPLPYFLKGLAEWWKIVPNIQNKQYDNAFFSYIDKTIEYADNIYSNTDNELKRVEAAFFMAAAYAFRGRLHSERQNWVRAAADGKRALKYHEKASDKSDLSPELLFGDGLYNYYAEWVPQNYPKLKPILWFFKKGDQALGLKQLEEVVQEAFYTRTEAQYFLMRIYSDEKEYEKAENIAEYLHTTYPKNPYFHRYYAISLFKRGQLSQLEPVSIKLLSRIDSGWTGYEATSGRYAAFYLGYINRVRQEWERAEGYFERAVAFGEDAEAYDAGYYLYSLAYLAQIADKKGDYLKAKEYYETIRDHANRKHSANKEAREYLKKNKKKFKEQAKNDKE
ncbi:MAG: tol-pal system protein YbgF [Bernardetiaceae bacterium]|nr:tol-pal system protein YbgF [Bernardetiaceae bacterium]